MDDLFQFIWHFSEDGYGWRNGPLIPFATALGKNDEPALIALGKTPQVYKPEDGLFLKFAAVNPDSDAEILNFANSYGLLGGGPRWLAREPEQKGATTASVTGELRSHWQNHIPPMRRAVSLWQAITAKDTSVLSQCIHWEGSDHISYKWPPSGGWITPWSTRATISSRDINRHLLERCQPGDVVMPARLYLQEVVNQSLKELVAPRLLWKPPDRNKMGLFFVPDTLIGFLWLQLANAIAGYCKFRICEGCETPMLVAAEGSGYRTNRKTCSNACRIRLYSRRKLEARQLRSQKLTIREIAKRLGAETEKVKKWIAE